MRETESSDDEERPPHDENLDEDDDNDNRNMNQNTNEPVETAQIQAVTDDGQVVDTYKNDEEDGARFFLILAALVCVVGVVIIVVMLVVVKDDDNGTDPATITTPPPSASPITMMADPQERLNIIRAGVSGNPATAQYVNIIPTTVAALENINLDDGTVNAVTRAAAWAVHVDPFPAEQEVLERFALAAIYYSTTTTTGGKIDWISKDGWFGDTSICDGWEGLRCCRDFHIEMDPLQCREKEGHSLVEVDLAENNLHGPIPPAVALLDSVHILWLEGNELTGTLDSFTFNHMANLEALYVHRNQLSGEIGSDIRGNGKLDTLFTHNNDFTGAWPDSFCPACKAYGDCNHAPVAYTLDCDTMQCAPFCCLSSQLRSHCFHEMDDPDDDGGLRRRRRQRRRDREQLLSVGSV